MIDETNPLKFYDIPLEVYLKPAGSEKEYAISHSNMRHLYWSFEQMLAHHSISGCDMHSGDMLASGTISGDDKHTQTGSMLELSWNGTKPIELGDGISRTFLLDGDTVILRGGRTLACGQYLGFGEVVSHVLPAPK